MLLRAAAVPPPEVREEIAAAVGSAVTPGTGLTPIPADRLHIVIAQFGNIPTEEVPRLLATLAEAMPDLGAAPTLHCGGGAISALDRHQGSAWTLSGLTLLRGSWAGEEKALGPAYEEHEHFPFAR